jgi:hypothetical protein
MRLTEILLLLSCLLGSMAAPADITAEHYLGLVKTLASEEFKGRGDDMPELQQAAAYLAGQFRACGVGPANGGYFQKFRATTGTSIGPANSLVVKFDAGQKQYRSGQDFTPLGISDPGTASGQAVFAGYGITADEFKYDDYKGLDVKGKIVLIMRHEPQEQQEKRAFQARDLTTYSRIVDKAINARLHGAAAVILVNDPHPHEGEEDALMKPEALMGPEHLGLPAIQVKREVADALLATAGKNLKDLQAAIDRDLSIQSLGLPVTVQLQVDVIRQTRELANVAALLRGNDPALRDEVVVIGGHYDHLGLGGHDSLAPKQIGQIHYGADDNASGAAGVVELACDLATHARELKRSVLFLSFAGEELGLLGSAYYTRNPLLPLEKTVAMINLDMIGRAQDRRIFVGGAGSATQFRSLIEEENKPIDLKLEFSSSIGYGGSDHVSFKASKVPYIFFFSGLHADYHKPSDTWDKINAADAADILRLTERVALRLDTQAERPAFLREAEPMPTAGTGGGGGGAWFGSTPDFGEVENGVRFADVREGSPAALAGFKAGDILVEFDGKPVKNLYDFSYLLRAHKPGDEVDVVVLRGTEKIRAKVKLARRPG